MIRELSRFCVYEVAHAWLAHAEPPPPKNTELVRLDQDCAALSTAGETDLDAQAVESSSQRFLAQAGPATPFPIAEPYGVRLAFLDTQPTYVGVPEWQGNSPHGYARRSIARCNTPPASTP